MFLCGRGFVLVCIALTVSAVQSDDNGMEIVNMFHQNVICLLKAEINLCDV
jgi:hypothetical protein